jgi:flagellar biosynthesis protein FliQ
MREEALEVFAHAVTTVFRAAVPIVVLSLIVAIFVPGRQLKGRAPSSEEKVAH